MIKSLACYLIGLSMAATGFCETSVGVAYSGDDAILTTQGDNIGLAYWAAGTSNGLLLQYAVVARSGAVFVADRILSFTAYRDPFFGKVADMWFQGRYGPGSGGQTVNVHLVLTESGYPGTDWGYGAVEFYLPVNSKTPFFARVGITANDSHILVSDSAGPRAADVVSNKGMAYGGSYLITNRGEAGSFFYNVASNYLFSLDWVGGVSFHGDRVRSFQCDTNGFWGRQAEIWVEGRMAWVNDSGGRATVARVVLTETAGTNTFDLAYIAIYLPSNLTNPIFERFALSGTQNHIICK